MIQKLLDLLNWIIANIFGLDTFIKISYFIFSTAHISKTTKKLEKSSKFRILKLIPPFSSLFIKSVYTKLDWVTKKNEVTAARLQALNSIFLRLEHNIMSHSCDTLCFTVYLIENTFLLYLYFTELQLSAQREFIYYVMSVA